jgi:LemA protein
MKRWLVLALLLPLGACGYNRIQTLDEQAASAQGQIEVQLQRRADLIPNLVNTVKGYAQHEEEVFTKVAEARAGLLGAIQTKDPEQMATANATMTGALIGCSSCPKRIRSSRPIRVSSGSRMS